MPERMDAAAVKDVVADAVTKLVAAKVAATARAEESPPGDENYWAQYDAMVQDHASAFKPIVAQALGPDEEYEALAERTENLVDAGEFALMVFDKVLEVAKPFLLAL